MEFLGFHVHRRLGPLYCMAAFGAFVFLNWILSRVGIIESFFSSSVLFSVFVFVFALPVSIFFLYLSTQKEPILSVLSDHVELRSNLFPWRTEQLYRVDVVDISTNWRGPRTSASDINFAVTNECWSHQRSSSMWHKKKTNQLYFDVSNCNFSPPRIVEVLRAWNEAEVVATDVGQRPSR